MDSIILFSSKDCFPAFNKFQSLKKEAEQGGLSVETYEDKAQIEESVGQGSSLFSEPKAIFLRGKFKKEEMLSTLDKVLSQDYSLVVLNYSRKFSVDHEGVEVEKISTLGGKELVDYIHSYAQDEGIEIAKGVIEEIKERVGENSWRIVNEIKKLAVYKDGEKITKKDINLLLSKEFESDVFDMVNALFYGNKDKALYLLEQELDSGTAPLQILGALFYQFRSIILSRDLALEDTDLKKWQYNKIKKQLPKYNEKDLGAVLQNLTDIHKGLVRSKDPKLLLSQFILQF